MLILALVSTPAVAANLFVPGDHNTIQDAVDAASPGDRIHVAAGSFAGATIDKQVRISGVGDQTVITNGPMSGSFVNGFRLISGADKTEISNLLISMSSGPATMNRGGIFGGAFTATSVATNVSIHNITFVNLNTAVFVRNTSGWRITDNFINGIRATTPGPTLAIGIQMSGSGHSLIANNTVFHNGSGSFGKIFIGINLNSTNIGQAENNKVIRNTISVNEVDANSDNDIELFQIPFNCDGDLFVFNNKVINNQAIDIFLTPSCLINHNVIH